LAQLEVELHCSTEWDEFWSYVGNKKNRRWTWYLLERKSGVILAWENGRRTADILEQLLDHVSALPIRICYTDNWAAYSKKIPEKYIHITGKDKTWKIERKNLNFRTHLKRLNRRTICFSKNEQIHDNIIGLYIETYYYKHGTFTQAAKDLNRA
jgi:insertion element IS1 protein InsB